MISTAVTIVATLAAALLPPAHPVAATPVGAAPSLATAAFDDPPDTEYPTVPGDLTTSVTTESFTLKWQPSTDNVGIDHYRIYYTPYGNWPFVLAGMTTPDTTTFTKVVWASSVVDRTFYVSVGAYDAAHNVSWADGVVVVPHTPPPPPPGG